MAARQNARPTVTCPNCRSRGVLDAVDYGRCAGCGFEIDAFGQEPQAVRAYQRMRGDAEAIVVEPVLDDSGRWLIAYTRLMLL